MNKMNTNETLNRMKSLMNYGLKTESKQAPFSAVEYQRTGADGKVYAIIREGKKYYIKSAPMKQTLVKEDFSYIGGFRNRKDNEYSNYASAQKNFDLKMMSIKEAADKKDYNVESWNLDKKENVVIENSEKMRKEILREHQIMKNAAAISENKEKECVNKPFCKPVGKEFGSGEEPNIKEKSDPVVVGEASEKVLGWNRNDPDYMDKSHGTEVGSDAPFDAATARNIDDGDKKVTNTGYMKNGVVENHGKSMHDTDNQNIPTPGVGEGPSDDNNDPFDAEKGKQIDEAIEDFGDDESVDADEPIGDDEAVDDDPIDVDGFGDDEESDIEGEGPIGDEGFDDEDLGDEDFDGDDDEDVTDDIYEDDIESRLSAMEDLISAIADKLGIDEPEVDEEDYEDDDLFDDGDDEGFDDGDDEEAEYELETSDEEPMDDEAFDDDEDDEMPMESYRRNGVQIVETANFKRAMNEASDKEWKARFDALFGGNPFDEEGCKKLGLDAKKLYGEKPARKSKKKVSDSTHRYGTMVNEAGMTPFTDAGRVPQGNMNKLDDFGKHPAYQKTVMSLPPKDHQEFPGYYDMNDVSVRNDEPYGEKIGDSAPFEIDPESIDNAIAEAFNRLSLKKKSNRR